MGVLVQRPECSNQTLYRLKTIIVPRQLNMKVVYILGQWKTLRLSNEELDIVYQYLLYKGFRYDDLDIVDNDEEGSIRIKKERFNV